MKKLGDYALTFVRLYLGAFNFAAGLNFFVLFLPQPVPADPVGSAYMHATLALGLFQFAKGLELVSGLMLICDVWVPLGLVLLFPVTVTIFIMDTFFADLVHVRVSGARNLVFHVILFAAYAKYFYPLLRVKAQREPIWKNWREIPVQMGLKQALKHEGAKNV